MKLDNKKLLGILLGLVLIFFITDFLRSNKQGEQTLPVAIVDLGKDSTVRAFSIFPENGGAQMRFSKEGQNWFVESNGVKSEADDNTIEILIDQIIKARPGRLVAKNKAQWEKYLLTDDATSKITFETEEGIVNLYVGKFSYTQEPGYSQGGQPNFKVTTYVRLNEGEEVYAIDEGFWASGLKRDFNSWRNAVFLQLNKESVRSIRFDYPEERFVMNKMDTAWIINDVVFDNQLVEDFIGSFSNRQERNFADDFVNNRPADYTIAFNGLDMSEVIVKCWKEEEQYYFNSSQNPMVYFESTEDGLFKELMVSYDRFLSD